ncbi:MAG: FAD-binding oxidoreductase [Inquilinus sp.]|nr:FAD-binding oxidoreductase [Inquilinus sp.]
MTATYDAVVIGAGVIGTSIALGLARKGLKPLCVDMGAEAGHGSTSGSSSIIRPFYSTVDGASIAYEAHFYWKDWAGFLGAEDERGHTRYVNTGNLVVKCDRNDHMRKLLAMLDRIGCPYEEWSCERLKERFPTIVFDSFSPARRFEDDGFGEPNGRQISGAVFIPTGGYVTDPALAAHNMQRAAEANGAVFRFRSKVAEILTGNGRVSGVALAGGERIAAPVVVNASGPHSYKVNGLAAGVLDGMTIKTRALREEVCHVPAPEGIDYARSGMHFSDPDTSIYSRPDYGNDMLLGSEGPECDGHIWVDPDDFDREFSDRWQLQVMRLAQRFPTLGIPSRTKGVVEMYDVSTDWIPIYDKSDLPGFYMAVGTSGNQFKNSPIVGQMMAELIAACEAGHDHDAEPIQFPLRHTGLTANLGFYSRKREVNEESSFSVLG